MKVNSKYSENVLLTDVVNSKKSVNLLLTDVMIIIIIIIIISIFKEDNVFSIIASLPYGPPVNTDIDYYQTFFIPFFNVCQCCNVSCAIFVRREASACLIMLSTKQGSHWYHF